MGDKAKGRTQDDGLYGSGSLTWRSFSVEYAPIPTSMQGHDQPRNCLVSEATDPMKQLQPLGFEDFAWETFEFPLCQLAIRAADLAGQHGLPLSHWEEDGLGEAVGFFCRLPSGADVLVQELMHAIEYLGDKGPAVYVDAARLYHHGPSALIAEVLDAFGLAPDRVHWRQSAEAIEGLKNLLSAD